MATVHSRQYMPTVYAAVGEQYNPDYPLFKLEIAEFCDDVTDVAKQVIADSQRHLSINDFLPKIKFRIFGIFSSTNENGVRRDPDEMDGATRAFTVIAGGLIAGLASFVFGSFYSDYEEASVRLERCEKLKLAFGEVWQIKGHDHCSMVKFVVDTEEGLARAEKRSAMINMAMTISIIAVGAILVAAGLFASIPLAIAALVVGVGIGIGALAKFGMNFFNKMPARKAERIIEKINALKIANEIHTAEQHLPFYTRTHRAA